MLNFIWTREPAEAYKNPYEYDAQAQFSREAANILAGFKNQLESNNRKYSRDDVSLEKAIWMLQTDAVDSLMECLNLLSLKKHKIAGRLFRDTIEVLDLAALFRTETQKSKNLLAKWFKDEVIPNKEYRDYIKKNISEEKAKQLSSFYSLLSRINHRTYKSLAYGYILGRGKKLVYDGFHKSDSLVFPGVISLYYSLLAHIISILSQEIKNSRMVSHETIEKIWNDCIEKKPEERRFVVHDRNQDN